MHEQSITFQLRAGPDKGKWVNTPGIYRGKPIDEDLAHKLHLEGKIPALGGKYFDSVNAAVGTAKKRSKSYDNPPSEEEVKELIEY